MGKCQSCGVGLDSLPGQGYAAGMSAVSVLFGATLGKIPGLVHGFSTRVGGVSPPPWNSLNLGFGVEDAPDHVAENHRRFAAAIGMDARNIRTILQVHSNRPHMLDTQSPLLRASGPRDTRGIEGDAIVVARPGVFVGVRTADCVPILLADPEARVAAAVHAGWRGTAAGVLARAIQMMTAAGAEAPRIAACMGPAISKDSFQVGQDVASALPAFTTPHPDGSWRCDLQAANRAQLLEAGVRAENIESIHMDTWSRPDLFFSHRRDRGRTGRHLGVIGFQQ
ncbi:MAG: Polyphenol oxidase [Myxococcota bacterium]|nr:Polyphenol oxidase [Myxococcota bacterium]